MQTLSKDEEQNVIEAVKSAVEMVDGPDGVTPDAAIEKVAREHSWGPDMIKFASFAYNTGRQAAQRETGKSVLDKLATFPLADPDKVISAVFPRTVKSASALQQTLGISDEYSRGPSWTARRGHDQKMAALRRDPLLKKAGAVFAAPRQDTLHDALDTKDRLKKAAEEARSLAAIAYEGLLGEMYKLAYYYKANRQRDVPFANLATAIQTKYGSGGNSLTEWVYKTAECRDPRELEKRGGLLEADWKTFPFNVAANCVKQARDVGQKRAAHERAVAALDAHVKDHINPFTAAPSAPIATPGFFSQPVKEAGIGEVIGGSAIGQTTRSLLDRAMGDDPNRAKKVNDNWMDLEDPAHDSQLREIRTQAMLADLMHDDVIGGYQPEQVAKAYNEISQMAPRTAGQPMALTALLRKRLQGHTEPFEAKEVTDIEKGLKDTHNVVPGPSASIMQHEPDKIIK